MCTIEGQVVEVSPISHFVTRHTKTLLFMVLKFYCKLKDNRHDKNKVQLKNRLNNSEFYIVI